MHDFGKRGGGLLLCLLTMTLVFNLSRDCGCDPNPTSQLAAFANESERLSGHSIRVNDLKEMKEGILREIEELKVQRTKLVQESDIRAGTADQEMKAAVEAQNEINLPHPLQAFDPFALWKRRKMVSNETVSAVLKSVARDSSCYKNSLVTPINSFDQVALAIRKKFDKQDIAPGQKLVLAVIGDSVAAPPNGFADALQSFLTLSPNIPFPVDVRNYAHGGRGPRYFSVCNGLRGDEDVVLFENVRPYEADGVLDLASSLVSRGFGVILCSWRAVATWNISDHLLGFRNASTLLGLPLLTFPTGRERIKECLPANANFSIPEEKQIYHDFTTHPNSLGEIMIATMIGQYFEDAARLYRDELDWNEVDTKRLSSIVNTPAHSREFLCFDELNCTDPPSAGEEFGWNRCLNVKSSDGFERKSSPSKRKFYWQGTQPGHSIEMIMPGTCSVISVFQTLRDTNGMVQVLVDGLVPESTPTKNGVLNGWYAGFWWLHKGAGHNIQSIIATDLPKEAEQHVVRFTVLNETKSEGGTYKFDITGMGCKT